MRPTPTSSSPGAWAGCSMVSTTRAEPPPSTPCGQLPPPTRPPTASPSRRPPGSPPPGGAERLAASVGFELHAEFVPPMTREERRSLVLHRAIAATLVEEREQVVRNARRNIKT